MSHRIVNFKKLNIGKLRLLALITKDYNIEPEIILDQLISDYIESRFTDYLIRNCPIIAQTPGYSVDIERVAGKLSEKTDDSFYQLLLREREPKPKRLSKEEQVQTINEGLDALFGR